MIHALKPFSDGTRYAAVGDSISQLGWYALYVELFYRTRFPRKELKVIDCGIAGEMAGDGIRRFEWDIFVHQPTVASIMFGMNDVNRELYSPASEGAEIESQRTTCIEDWARHTRKLIQLFKKNDVEIILIAPSIFDETSSMASPNLPGCNVGLGRIAERTAALAESEKTGFIDFYHPMAALNRNLQAIDPAATIIGPDRVHPGNAGHLYMAYLFLTAQNVPTEIASASLDSASRALIASSNCKVDQISADGRGLTFQYLAHALPFPIDPAAAEAAIWESAIHDLNREMLTVSNLPAGSYDLIVDGKKIHSYTADEFSQGINLTAETTMPGYQQALQVLHLCKVRWEAISVLRAIALGDSWEHVLPHPVTLEQMEPAMAAKIEETAHGQWAEAVASDVARYRALKGTEAKVGQDIKQMAPALREAAQPVAHNFQITPTTEW